MIIRFFTVLLAASLFLATPTRAADSNVGYYGFEPDIITNYVSQKKNIGFIRITAELMIEDVSDVPLIEHHSPLLRDAIIDVLIRQSEQKVKSMTGREEIRVTILERLQDLMKRETGKVLIKDLLFTKYLYH